MGRYTLLAHREICRKRGLNEDWWMRTNAVYTQLWSTWFPPATFIPAYPAWTALAAEFSLPESIDTIHSITHENNLICRSALQTLSVQPSFFLCEMDSQPCHVEQKINTTIWTGLSE